jgi:hypothetical protein
VRASTAGRLAFERRRTFPSPDNRHRSVIGDTYQVGQGALNHVRRTLRLRGLRMRRRPCASRARDVRNARLARQPRAQAGSRIQRVTPGGPGCRRSGALCPCRTGRRSRPYRERPHIRGWRARSRSGRARRSRLAHRARDRRRRRRRRRSRRDGSRWRRRSRSRRRCRLRARRRSRRRGRRCRCGSSRQERERIDIGDVVRLSDPEVHVGNVVLRNARWSRLRDGLSLCDSSSPLHEQPPEVRQRRLAPVGGGDRDRETIGGHLPGERDLTRSGRPNGARRLDGDVDASVLSCCIRIVNDREPSEHLSVRRPAPRRGGRDDHERHERDRESDSCTFCCLSSQRSTR